MITFTSHYELTEYAQNNGFNTLKFEVLGISMSTLRFKFLDAYYGFVQQLNESGDAEDGFFRVSDLKDYVIMYTVIED